MHELSDDQCFRAFKFQLKIVSVAFQSQKVPKWNGKSSNELPETSVKWLLKWLRNYAECREISKLMWMENKRLQGFLVHTCEFKDFNKTWLGAIYKCNLVENK